MSKIPKVGFGVSRSKDKPQQENSSGSGQLVKKTSGSNLKTGFKRPSDDHSTNIGKRFKTDVVGIAKGKVLSTMQPPAVQGKFATTEKSKKALLQPMPDNGLVRCSMPAVVSTTKIKIPGKPKRPAWDLKGRIQDMEENFIATQKLNDALKCNVETYNNRIAALEAANSMLHRDVEIKSVESEEATSQIQKLEIIIKQKTEEYESFTNEKVREIEKCQKEIQSLKEELSRVKNEYENLQNMYQQETSALRNTITSVTCMKSGIQAELDATKLMLENQQREVMQWKEKYANLESQNETLKNQVSLGESKLREEESLRRKLHNTVQELKGNIRVFCRLRPPLHEELNNKMNLANIVAVSDKAIEIQQLMDIPLNESGGKNHPKYEFSFDCYFSETSSQEQIFDEISQLIQSALDGYNVCIFAYGQTGSGKTFTMEGPAHIVDFVANQNHPDLGMIPRSVQQIFSTIAVLELKGWKYKVEALFLEIYNERIRDLLNSQSGNNTKCEIVKSGTKGTDCIVSNVITSQVSSAEQVYELMKKARINRAMAATKCNEYSSRSHYVFQMKIYGENSITGEKCDGTLNLVDLAGSERVKDSESAGERLTEAKAINKSLSNLGKVIMSLSKKENHVPYRDSKLTHLLANSLGGSSKTLMFVNISPDNKNLTETINSLRFATKVNQCNIGTAQRRVK